MKKSFSRIASIFLAIVMLASVFSCLGITASAAGYDVVSVSILDDYYVGDTVEISATLKTGGNDNQTYGIIVQDERGKIVANFADSFPTSVGISTRTFLWDTTGLKAGSYSIYAENMRYDTIEQSEVYFELKDPNSYDFDYNYADYIVNAAEGSIYTPLSIKQKAKISLGSEEDYFNVTLREFYTGSSAKDFIYNYSNEYTWSDLETLPGQSWMVMGIYFDSYSENHKIDTRYYFDQYSFCNFQGQPYNILKVADLYDYYDEVVVDEYGGRMAYIAVLTDTPIIDPYFAIKYTTYDYCYFNLNRNYKNNYTLAQDENGNWFAYLDGEKLEYTSKLIEYNGELWYADGGVDFNREGIWYTDDGMVLLKGGHVDGSYNGFYDTGDEEETRVYYIKNGFVDYAFNGFHEYEGNLYYFERGYASPYSYYDGLTYYNGTWYYVSDGEVQWDYNGLMWYEGEEFVITNGIVDFGYNGVYEYGEEIYYITNGRVDDDFTSLVLYNDEFRYFEDGRISYYNTLCPYNGNYYYVCDSRIDFTYNGIVWYEYFDENLDEWIYNRYIVENGVVNFGINGLHYIDYDLEDDQEGYWYLVNNGVVNEDYRGLYNHYGNWYFVSYGTWDDTYNTMTKYNGTFYAVTDGMVDWTYSGIKYYDENWEADLYENVEGKLYVFSNGSVTTNINGLVYIDEDLNDDIDGDWVYSNYGIFEEDYCGLVYHYGTYYYVEDGYVDWYPTLCYYNNTWYYVNGGVVDYSNTLAYYNDTWYYVNGGTVQWNANTLVNYAGNWYVVSNGVVDWSYSGQYYYNGTYYAVSNGAIQWDNTLANLGGVWYHVNNGVVQWGSNTLVSYANNWYYVENAQVNWDFTGLVYYNGVWYYVQSGSINFDYTGLAYHIDGNWYYVQNGAINFGYTGPVVHVDNNSYNVVNGVVVF